MSERLLRLRVLVVLAGATFACACAKPAQACSPLSAVVNTPADATLALRDCIAKLPIGGRLELRPGTYTVRRPLVIARQVSISTAGLGPGAPSCAEPPAARCATLLIDPQQARESNSMPVLVAANGVRLSHLIVRGVGATARQRSLCGLPASRPLGGGLRVSGSGFVLRNSVLRDFACYTAMEVTTGANAPVIEDNVIGPNGDHRPGEVWADGVTIHDSQAAVVRRNLFVDNTDVQLILGGCRDCRIENNRFRHSGSFSKASFAELMLHSWPNTSGDFQGTVVRGNDIDCGQGRQCGYGVMVGAAPWYAGRMSGGTISGNVVRNAMIGLNVDGLTGPVHFRSNEVVTSGGRYRSDCGPRDWPAVNVGPGSARLIKGDPSHQKEAYSDTAGCLLNRQPH